MSDVENAEGTQIDPLADRAIRLFTFLGQAQQLRNPSVTDLEAYRRDGTVLWLHELPTHPSLLMPLHGGSLEPDVPVLIVERVARHAPPQPGPELSEWVSGKVDDPRVAPALRPERWVTDDDTEDTDPAGPPPQRRVTPEDQPRVIEQFDRFLTDWRAWSEQDLRDEPARRFYGELFSTYVRVSGYPEELEFVLATGLLAWEPDAHAKVRRHMLSVAVSLSFDDESGRLTVTVDESANGTRVELDMLDPGLHGDPRHVNAVREDARSAQSHPLDRDRRGELARRLVHLFSAEAEYLDETAPAAAQTHPVASFAPALILRRRSQQGLVEIFRQIVDRITTTGEVPAGVRPLVDPDHVPGAVGGAAERPDGALVRVDDDPFLPLPVNDVQLKILSQVDSHAQTLIQGPPGTGKTHTAAVLISHLLAQGKRVLVTAHTDRALKEVRGKLPEPIRPLAVSVVGSSREDMSDLRVAVERIAANAADHDSDESARAVAQSLQAIEALRRRRAELYHELVEAREREVRQHEIDGYRGPLASLIEQHAAQRPDYGWIEQYVQDMGAEPPLSNTEIGAWRARLLDPELTADEPQAAGRLIPITELVEPTLFGGLVGDEARAMQLSERYKDLRARSEYAAIAAMIPRERAELGARLSDLAQELRDLTHRTEPWIREALADVRNNRATNWIARRDQVAVLIYQARPILAVLGPVVNVEVSGEPAGLVAPAEALATYLENGGSLKLTADGAPKIRSWSPGVVKQAAGLFERVRVDGGPPVSVPQLRAFLTWVQGDRVLDALDRAWPVGVSIPPEDTLGERLQWHVTELELLARVVEMGSRIRGEEQRLRSACLPWPNWADDAEIQAFAALPGAAAAADRVLDAGRPLSQLAKRISADLHWSDSAEVIARLHEAVQRRDVPTYTSAHERLVRLHYVRVEAGRRDAATASLMLRAPELTRAVLAEPKAPSWDARLGSFAEAWSWAAVGRWLADRTQSDVNTMQAEVIRVEDGIRDHVQELSATRAWDHAVGPDRLSRRSRAHLEQYARLVRQFGKTGGMYREQRKAEIRDAMDRCRSAVPVWIMPLYRIADQLRITPDMFDVVIVDEASQAGVEATFLQYLAPRIVVIGDDKQVSPSAVGVNRQQLRDLGNQYLYDDSFRATWQEPQQSLFDEAKMRFSGMLTLVEHRRCVPEIIGFSNQIAYEPDNIRLIPVRQFGADRLDPICTEFVKDGYERGGSSARVNPPEAEAIVAQIEKCLEDPRYGGLTFGVISLLGAAQARLIERLLQERIAPQELLARELRCGDAADFQGSERDVVFLSMVASPGTDRRLYALTKTEYVQRYNVAASRAKDQMWLFHSVDPATLGNAEDMRRQLLDYCYGIRSRRSSLEDGVITSAVSEDVLVTPFDSRFEQRVFNRLLDRGFTVIPQFEALGYRLDLVVVGAEARLAVECDGDRWHGPEAYQRDMARQRELERCGWHFFRVLESDFTEDPARALAPLWERLTELGIDAAGWTNSTQEETEAEPAEPTGADEQEPVHELSDGSSIPPLADTVVRVDEPVERDLAAAPSALPKLTEVEPAAVSNMVDVRLADTIADAIHQARVNSAGDRAVDAVVSTGPCVEADEELDEPVTQSPDVAAAASFGNWLESDGPQFAAQPPDALSSEDRTLLLTRAQRAPLTTQWVAKVMAITQQEARAVLRALVDEGALQRSGQNQGSPYVLPGWDQRPQARPHAPARDISRTFVASREQQAQVLRAARHAPVTNERVRKLLQVSADTATEILSQLVASGELDRRGQGRGTSYRLVERGPIVVPRPRDLPSAPDNSVDEIAQDFSKQMVLLADRAQSEAGYNPTVYRRMLSARGPLGTAKMLLRSGSPGYGFTELWERDRLDLTVEALVLTEPFCRLFTDDELDVAARRLADFARSSR